MTTSKAAVLFQHRQIIVENQTDSKIDLENTAQLVDFLRDSLGLDAKLGVDVTFVDVDTITDLHFKHMGEPGPTDVLSFPMDLTAAADGAGVLGDIVICPEFAWLQVDEQLNFQTHLQMLITHSMLHLIGHDHPDDSTRTSMFAKQDKLLASWRLVGPCA